MSKPELKLVQVLSLVGKNVAGLKVDPRFRLADGSYMYPDQDGDGPVGPPPAKMLHVRIMEGDIPALDWWWIGGPVTIEMGATVALDMPPHLADVPAAKDYYIMMEEVPT